MSRLRAFRQLGDRLPSPLVVTRGERIRRARNQRMLSIKDLAEQVGISESTLGRIELGKVKDPRSIHAVEAHLGLSDDTEETPARVQMPRLDEATNTELAYEVHRRLTAAESADEPVLPEVPPEVLDNPRLVRGPADPQTGHTVESDG